MSHINEDTVGNVLLKKRVGWQKKVNCLTSLKQFVTYVTYIMSQISKTTNMFDPILLHLTSASCYNTYFLLFYTAV